MRMLAGAVAVIGAIAVGGVPALAITAGQPDQGVQQAGEGPPKPADKNADGKPGYGPPAHARSSHNVAKPRESSRQDSPEDSRDDRADRPDKVKPNEHAKEMSALGREHAEAMRAWGACVSEQPNAEAEGFDPEGACGARPTPPGHLKHPAKHRPAAR